MNMRDAFPWAPRPARRIAVVGAGISGLACAWMLSREHAVTVFEAGKQAGGHTNTVDVTVDGMTHPVDTGFLVFNRRTYPNLIALFGLLGVEAVETEMSFSVSLAQPDLEWSGTSLRSLFAQPGNAARPGFWRMLRDILRFNREATRLAREGDGAGLALGEYLTANAYSREFRDWYLLPMAAAIWSCPTRTMLDYPLDTFVRFCDNHGLLQIADRPRWLTVHGGGREYVRRMCAQLDDLRLDTPVLGVFRDAQSVWVHTPRGVDRFDEVVFACHSDQALEILGAEASSGEREILSAVRYQRNRAVLHTDADLLPRRRAVWAAWNYAAAPAGESAERAVASVSVSYLINRLQPLPFDAPVAVTLNPLREPDPARVLASFDYAHPVFDVAAIAAQRALGTIQGVRRTWFAGAWTGYGFHEDGLKSALPVVEALGGSVPWRGGARVAEACGA